VQQKFHTQSSTVLIAAAIFTPSAIIEHRMMKFGDWQPTAGTDEQACNKMAALPHYVSGETAIPKRNTQNLLHKCRSGCQKRKIVQKYRKSSTARLWLGGQKRVRAFP
jgi:hypothetical protein